MGSDTFQQNTSIQIWCAIVSVYIVVYIVIEASKGKINKFKGAILNYGIWINLVAFVPYLLTMALYPNDAIISGFPLVAFFVAIITVFWSPIILIIMLALEFLLSQIFNLKT